MAKLHYTKMKSFIEFYTNNFLKDFFEKKVQCINTIKIMKNSL